jgi:hypothetical protein
MRIGTRDYETIGGGRREVLDFTRPRQRIVAEAHRFPFHVQIELDGSDEPTILKVGQGFFWAGLDAAADFPNYIQGVSTTWPTTHSATPDELSVSALGDAAYLLYFEIYVNPSTGLFDATYLPELTYIARSSYATIQDVNPTIKTVAIVLADFTVASGKIVALNRRRCDDIYVQVRYSAATSDYYASLFGGETAT